MADHQQPATKEDIAQLRAEVKQDLAQLRVEVKQDLAQLRVEVKQDLVASAARLIEQMRDMQTEMLRGLERFAAGNFARMHRLESSDNAINERINSLEERVLTLELRNPPPIAPPPQS